MSHAVCARDRGAGGAGGALGVGTAAPRRLYTTRRVVTRLHRRQRVRLPKFNAPLVFGRRVPPTAHEDAAAALAPAVRLAPRRRPPPRLFGSVLIPTVCSSPSRPFLYTRLLARASFASRLNSAAPAPTFLTSDGPCNIRRDIFLSLHFIAELFPRY